MADGQRPPVRQELSGGAPPRCLTKRCDCFAGGHVPEAKGVVVRGGGKQLAVRRESQAPNPVAVPWTAGQQLSHDRVPELNVGINGAGDNLAVRRKGSAEGPAGRFAQAFEFLARTDLPNG